MGSAEQENFLVGVLGWIGDGGVHYVTNTSRGQAGRQAGGILIAHTLFLSRYGNLDQRGNPVGSWLTEYGLHGNTHWRSQKSDWNRRPALFFFSSRTHGAGNAGDGRFVTEREGICKIRSDLFAPERTVPVGLLGWGFVGVVTIFLAERTVTSC